MADIAHKNTDKIIDELDKKLNTVYSQASKEMQEKLDKYIQSFETKDKVKLAEFKSGKITKQEYDKWKLGQVKIGEKWTEMRDTLASDMTNTNQIAASLINGHKPTVYALNHNYSTFQLEKDSLVDTSYTLYSHDAVENLIKNEPNLLPKNKVNVPKDKAWNRKKIDNAVTQGILQGESLKDVSGRLKDVTDMNQNAAVRNARTAMTGAQNAGRIDAYKRAKDLGMSVKKVWLATLDGRTRHSHRMLDGETIDIDEKFSNGLRFPGDADGIGAEVYNCRCTLLGQPKGIDYKVSDLTRRDDKLEGMSYETWKHYHDFGLEGADPDAMIANAWSNLKMSNIYNLIKEQNVTDANKFYNELKKIGKPSDVWTQYLNGELDADDIAKFEGILKNYLPDSTVKKIDNIADSVGDHAKFLASFSNDDIYSNKISSDVFDHIYNHSGKMPIDEYWQKYLAGEVNDPQLDKLLGYKPVVKVTNTADKIDDDVIKLIGGKNDPILTDSIDDYFLPKATRDKLDTIKSLDTYDDVEKYLKAKGIDLDVGIDKLKNEMKFDTMPPAVKSQCQKICTAVDAYEDTFGKDALSKLKKIYLYDEDLDPKAAYFFNVLGENDPLAGEIHFRDWNATGRDIFHELAHAFQDSHAGIGEDALIYSDKMVIKGKLPKSFKAYTGAISDDAINAEKFADAFSFAFTHDSEVGKEFLNNIYKLESSGKKIDKVDDIADAAKAAKADLKIPKGNPMSKVEADDYKVNVFYDINDKTTLVNCQTDTFVYECRRQGYDVVALPKDKIAGDVFDMQNKLGIDQGNGWINKVTGDKPEKLVTHNAHDIQTKKEIIDELENVVGTNGERYTLGVHWQGGGAHALNLDRDEYGIIRIIDNQRGPNEKNTWTLEEYLNGHNVKNIRAVYRVDDCVPNPEYFNKIVVPADKVKDKIGLPSKVSALDSKEYSQLHKIAKIENESPSKYYYQWKHGIIDDDKLDDLLVKPSTNKVDNTIKPTAPKPVTPKPSKPVTVLPETDIQDKFKDWNHKYYTALPKDAYHKLDDIANANGISMDSAWKKYLSGEIKNDDLDNLLGITKPNIKPSTKSISMVDLDGVKDKKVTQIYNELKDEFSSKDANAFYNELKKIGANDGLKQGDVWKKYVNGELDPGDMAKIDSHLLKKYPKVVEPTEPEVDLFALSNKKMSQVYNELKLENTTNANKFYNELKTMGKPSEVWEKYLNGELSEDKQKIIDKYLVDKYQKGGVAKPAVKAADTKSDELIKAEAKLKKAQDELKKADTGEVFSGIWKEDVTLADYESKKGTINAKKIYFEDEIDKLKNDPDYKSWLSAEDKEYKIMEFQHKLGLLDEFEVDGKKYAKLQKEVTKAQQEVQKYAPSPFSNSYSQERKDAALWPKSRQEADSLFIAHSQAEWDAAKPAERKAIKEYTSSYHKFNEPLRGIQYGTSAYKGVGNTDLNAGYANNGKALNAMTDYLDKCSSEHDQWLQRGCGWSGMDKFLQIDMNKLQYGTEKELQDALLGKTITEYGFMSAGTAKGKGFSGNILFNIFTPKGTKMSYAELYSHFKGGSEVETIIQQGSQFIITKVEKTNGQIYIDIELVNQLPPQRWNG